MRRTSLFSAMAFLAGLGLGGNLVARSAGTVALPRSDNRAADLAAIEKLHKLDVDATLTQDLSALTSLWSDGAINLGFSGPPVVGVKAIRAAYEKFKADYPDFKVVKYAPNITDVQIVDGWALEVGDFVATYKMSATADPVGVNDKGMRVLKRQSDGSWKFAVVGLK